MKWVVIALALVAVCLPSVGRAVDEDTVGWWIYVGSVRSTLISRYLGPEGAVPDTIAATRAARACGVQARVERLNPFNETPPGDEPIVFGPFIGRGQVAASLDCVRRYVPAAFITQTLPPE